MSLRIVTNSIWKNPGNRGKRFRKTLDAIWWQIHKRTIGRPTIIRLANRARFRAYPDCVISSALQYAEWPEYDELNFCRQRLHGKELVVDVGANVGHLSLLLSDVVGPDNLICFEPTPVSWRRLRENFELNSWSTSQLYNAAVGQFEGVIEVQDLERPDTTSSVGRIEEGVKKVTVRLIPLDSLVTSLAGRRVGLLKVDVEGFEREVFLGAMQFLAEARPNLIMFESLEGKLDDVVGKILSNADYIAFKLGENGRCVLQPLDAQNLFAAPNELFPEILNR